MASMNRGRLFALVGALAVMALLSPAVMAIEYVGSNFGDIYGVTFGDSSTDKLIRIDPNTGAGTLVGSLDTKMQSFGLASNGSKLYTYDQEADMVRQLDPFTGNTINSFSAGIDLTGEGGFDIRASDGMGFLMANDDGTGKLYEVNFSSQTVSLVGATSRSMDGLAFASDGTLYGLTQGLRGHGSDLVTVDTSTGAVTVIGDLGVAEESSIGGLTFDPLGNLFAVAMDNGVSKFYQVNQTTGQATLIGDVGFNGVSGMTFVAVPEPATLTLCGLGLLGLWAKRRKMAKA